MRLFCAIALLLTLSCAALAAPPLDLTVEERAWLAKNRDKLVLCYDRSFPPIEFENSEGFFTGLSADLVAHIEETLGVTFRKQPTPWGDVLRGLQKGTAHLAPALMRTPEREQYTLFSPAYARIPLVIITTRNITRKLTLDDLGGMRVAVVRGYASGDIIQQSNLGRYTIVEVDSIPEGLREVAFGTVDVFVESLAVAAWYIQEQGLSNLRVAGDIGVTQELSLGVSRQYPLLASAVSKALATLPDSEMQRLNDRWIRLPAQSIDPRTRNALIVAVVSILAMVLLLAGLTWILSRKLRRKVSELEHTEAALMDQVGRFRLAMEATQAGYWEFFPGEKREEHSPEWYTMLGYPPKRTSGSLESWSDLIHPSDRQPAMDTFSGYIREGGHGMYEAEYRMRAHDGSWRWILAKGRTVAWDDAGRPTRIIGLNIDIHKTREAQEDVARFQALNRALMEQTSQFIGLLSLHGILLTTNQTALEWAGAKPEDVIGKPFWDGPWWPDRDRAEAMLRQVIEQVRAGETVRREILHVDPEGRHVVFDFTASPFRDETGKVVNIIVEGRDISELKQKQLAIEESERRFRTIFENAPYSISINRLSDGKYMDANTAFLEKLGTTRQKLLDLSPEKIGAIPGEHRDEILLALRHRKNVHNLETRVHSPDGGVRHILYSGGLITIGGEDCVLSMTVDITELKTAQEALRRSEEMFSRLFHLSPDMITLARESDGTLLEINEAFTRFTGYSRDEALGKTTLGLGIFAVPARRGEFAAILMRDGHVENFEFDISHRDGHILHASASAKLMAVDDVTCILAITRDITHLRAMQDTMVQSEKMLSLGGIAAGIAHEINNPLGIVLQAVQTIALRTKPDFPKNIEAAARIGVDLDQVARYLGERKIDLFIRDIQGAAVRAAEIIRHMLDFSRRSESRRSVCDIGTVIENALRLASSDYDLKRNYDFRAIEIVRDIPPNLPPCECTETEIEQVLLNLLRNAAQAMSDTDPPTAAPRISIRARDMEPGLSIEIADNGPGISPENRKRIFEPFFTTKSSGAGTGLGLSVSYFIITKGHGGRMHVACPPEGGTVFTVELPGPGRGAESASEPWTRDGVST
jgi:PAS domain S-box-containing protein